MILDHATSDWLASRNIFYNTRTNKISDNINELIDSRHIVFHPEGLCTYLDYGFCVFGMTPLEEIKMLEPNMTIYHDDEGGLVIDRLQDPFERYFDQTTTEADALDSLRISINNWVNQQKNQIILPLSGGFDSRIMLSMINDTDKVYAFTYGISERQEESMEVVYAKAVAERRQVRWEQINLSEFPQYIDKWDELFGISTHAHGMYHMEFYKKIRELVGNNGSVMSGILGDLYAGSWRFEPLESYFDIPKLAITHGLCADSNHCLLKNEHDIEKSFFDKNKEKLRNENWRVLTAARMKISLLSYLLRTAENEGFNAWSPFLEESVVAKIMTLPWEKKNRRKWQVDYFRSNDLLAGEWGLNCTKDNDLDYVAFRDYSFEKLDYACLADLFEKEYIDRINQCIERRELDDRNHNREMNAWFTIYPIQMMLKRL